MKKKEFFLDPKVVLQKRKNMMERQIRTLEQQLLLSKTRWGPLEPHNDCYCCHSENGNALWIEYCEDAKFAAKTFGTKITLIINNVSMDAKWAARLTFRGRAFITDIVWRPEKKEYTAAASALNQMTAFNTELLAAAREIDLEIINLSYSRDRQRLTVEILPYAGTYVWVKLPPAHCEVPLRDAEIRQICNIINIFERTF